MNHLGFTVSAACPQLLYHPEQHIRMAVHVDDPRAAGHKDKLLALYDALGKWLTVRMGSPIGSHIPTRYLGCDYLRYDTEIIEAPSSGYVDAMAEIVDVSSVRPISTPSVRI